MNWNDLFQIETIVLGLLIFFRCLGIFFVSPMLGNRAVPQQVRIAFSLLMAVAILPFVEFPNVKLALSNDVLLITMIVQEVTIGIIIGFVAAIIFACVSFVGEIMGLKLGFAIAQIVDPNNQGSAGLFTSFLVLIAGLLFLVIDAHHYILLGLRESFEVIPVGQQFSLEVGAHLNGLLTKVFAIAIKICAPIIVVMTILYFAYGFITKLSPQMNIYFNIGFVLSPILGILVVMVSLPMFRLLLTNLFGNLDHELIAALAVMKGN